MYDEIFLDAFINHADKNDRIDRSKYCSVVKEKVHDDPQLKRLLIG